MYKVYRQGAAKRGREFLITFDDFMELWQKPCYYCGTKITSIGIDRKDNDIGYVTTNIVACCKKCNYMKRALSDTEFIEQARVIAIKFSLTPLE